MISGLSDKSKFVWKKKKYGRIKRNNSLKREMVNWYFIKTDKKIDLQSSQNLDFQWVKIGHEKFFNGVIE